MVDCTRIKEVRGRLGESQANFGRRFGVDQSTIHRWETVGVPDRGTASVAIDRVLREIEDGMHAPSQERGAA